MNSENDTKICPFCGESIKLAAIKCKHCGEFLNGGKKNRANNSESAGSRKKLGKGCLVAAGSFILLGLLGLLVPEADLSYDSGDMVSNDDVYEKVTGQYEGFGTLAVLGSNLGGQAYNCLEKGVGISLVEKIENFFENVSETNRPEFYSMKDYNPKLKFVVTNPRWAGTVNYMPEACLADVEFKNIKSDTIVGYKGDTPYTIDEADCAISYTVSEQSGKFKANVFNMACKSNAGYR